jgi:MFS family permease
MIKENIFLLIANGLLSMGYSLIAPLYPPLANERDIREKTVGVIISIFAVANFFATIYSPKIIRLVGRKKLLYVAIFIEAICTLVYGMLFFISSRYLFLLVSFITRFIHGVGCAFSTTLSKFLFLN